MATKTKSTKVKVPKHPDSQHPATGRLGHKWTNVIQGDGQLAGRVQQGSKSCTICGFDEDFHDLTPDDFTGHPEHLATYLRALPKRNKGLAVGPLVGADLDNLDGE